MLLTKYMIKLTYNIIFNVKYLKYLNKMEKIIVKWVKNCLND